MSKDILIINNKKSWKVIFDKESFTDNCKDQIATFNGIRPSSCNKISEAKAERNQMFDFRKVMQSLKFLILFSMSVFSFCFKTYSFNKNRITIVCDIPDTHVDSQEIVFEYYDYYSFKGFWPVKKVVRGLLNHKGVEFVIDDTQNGGYLKIIIPPYLRPDPIISTTFLIQGGDQLILTRQNKRLIFKGENAEKYNVQLKLKNITAEPVTGSLVNDLEYFNKIAFNDSVAYEKRMSLLQKAKKNLPLDFFEIIKINASYDLALSTLGKIMQIIMGNSEISRNNAIIFFKLKYQTRSSTINSEFAVRSYNYLDYLFENELVLWEITCLKYPHRTFCSFFTQLERSYKGKIRDRLLLTSINSPISFVSNYRQDSTFFYTNRLLDIATDPFTRSVLTNNQKVFAGGVKVFDFKLRDTSNNYVQLSSLRGKVVIIDYYFTGCAGCIALNKNIEATVQQFKEDSTIVFVSINLDKTMNQFKRAVIGGKYSHPASINLYTNGEGEQHPLIRYYQIKACPRLMIIAPDGRMFNSDISTTAEDIASRLTTIIIMARNNNYQTRK
jgi:thiol-disulfide isomerase/thioredoxin